MALSRQLIVNIGIYSFTLLAITAYGLLLMEVDSPELSVFINKFVETDSATRLQEALLTLTYLLLAIGLLKQLFNFSLLGVARNDNQFILLGTAAGFITLHLGLVATNPYLFHSDIWPQGYKFFIWLCAVIAMLCIALWSSFRSSHLMARILGVVMCSVAFVTSYTVEGFANKTSEFIQISAWVPVIFALFAVRKRPVDMPLVMIAIASLALILMRFFPVSYLLSILYFLITLAGLTFTHYWLAQKESA